MGVRIFKTRGKIEETVEEKEIEEKENLYQTTHDTFIYDNGYIKIYAVEHLTYEIINKSFSNDENILTKDELSKYNIDINNIKESARIKDLYYSFRLNDTYINCKCREIKIRLINSVDNIISFFIDYPSDRYSSYSSLDINKFVAYLNSDICYNECNIGRSDFYDMEEETKKTVDMVMKFKLKNNPNEYATPLEFYKEYRNSYDAMIKDAYESTKKVNDDIDKNLVKVRKFVKNEK